MNALAAGGEDVARLDCLPWLLGCQHQRRHPFTGADPGGWGWSDLSGAVPDADDTPGALLALAHWWHAPSCDASERPPVERAAAAGLRWLLALQNRDGGWPTFCRGWGKLPFDRSGADLTAHVLRCCAAWRDRLDRGEFQGLAQRVEAACQRGRQYLARQQRADGSWIPLWFGNQDHPAEENPVYGTARVLLAYRDLGLLETPVAVRGCKWLAGAANNDGGWSSGPAASAPERGPSSVEETAVAVEALLGSHLPEARRAASRGLEWLLAAVESSRHTRPSPIGFYFAKLWYYEKLYPLTFTVSALGQALQAAHPGSETKPIAASLPPA